MTCQRQVSILSYTHIMCRGPSAGTTSLLPLAPHPFSVSNVQTISKEGEPSERMSCHRLTDIA